MPETEPQHIIPGPEDILNSQEATILQQADKGLLSGPCYGQPLEGGKVFIESLYEGVLLSCPDVAVWSILVEGKDPSHWLTSRSKNLINYIQKACTKGLTDDQITKTSGAMAGQMLALLPRLR